MQLVYYSSQSLGPDIFHKLEYLNFQIGREALSPQSLGQFSGIEHYIFFPVEHENIQQMKQKQHLISLYLNSGNSDQDKSGNQMSYENKNFGFQWFLNFRIVIGAAVLFLYR